MNLGLAHFIETKLITIVIIIAAIFLCLIRFDLTKYSNYEQLLTNTITISSIFIGVIMSMLGFLLTISARKIILKLVQMNFHKMILRYFISPIAVGVFLVLMSLIGSVALSVTHTNKFIYPIISIVWIVSGIYFLLAFIRITLLVYRILDLSFNEISEGNLSNEIAREPEAVNKIVIDNDLSEPEEDFY
ncbi:MAG: hypothetical protein ACRC6T_11520 [Sarcina sp.]